MKSRALGVRAACTVGWIAAEGGAFKTKVGPALPQTENETRSRASLCPPKGKESGIATFMGRNSIHHHRRPSMSPLSLHWLSRLAGCICLYARSPFSSLSQCFLCVSRDSSLLNFATRQERTRSYICGFLIEAGRRSPSHTGDLLKIPHRRHSSHESAAALAASAAVSRCVEAASCTTLQIRVASPCLLERGLWAGRHVSRSSPGAGATLNHFSGTRCRPAPSPTAELDRLREVTAPASRGASAPDVWGVVVVPRPFCGRLHRSLCFF